MRGPLAAKMSINYYQISNSPGNLHQDGAGVRCQSLSSGLFRRLSAGWNSSVATTSLAGREPAEQTGGK